MTSRDVFGIPGSFCKLYSLKQLEGSFLRALQVFQREKASIHCRTVGRITLEIKGNRSVCWSRSSRLT